MVQTHQQPSGFASRCDWVIGSRPVHWGRLPNNTAWGRVDKKLPRTVFVQTEQLQTFNDDILPCFPATHRFVLVIGDHDGTTPKQVDMRYESPYLKATDWQAWLEDDRILHLFVEHLDTVSPRDRVTAIPLGLNPQEFPPQRNPDVALDLAPKTIQISNRPIRIAFTNRVRSGKKQWADRGAASKVCEQLPHCDNRTSAKGESYTKMIQQYPFLLCVRGGGIDPNPNVFVALLAGVIPIIAPFPGQTVYDGLPVVITDGSWNESSPYLSTAYLAEKLKEFAPYFEDPVERAKVLERLTAKYWWDQVESYLADADSHDAKPVALT